MDSLNEGNNFSFMVKKRNYCLFIICKNITNIGGSGGLHK